MYVALWGWSLGDRPGLETWHVVGKEAIEVAEVAKRSVSLSVAGNRDDTSSHATIYFYVLTRLLASQKTPLIHGHQEFFLFPTAPPFF